MVVYVKVKTQLEQLLANRLWKWPNHCCGWRKEEREKR
jgi:hypothetical protein